ncbi:MAG: hypothetical protein EOM50_25005 [Erysipelotrichia bacterium]|nr:hypothetical protein [Erysipelotrichia bacterium]
MTSLRGASRQIVEKEQCGIFYDDAKSLIEGITQLNKLLSVKERMSQNALNLFHREFDSSRVYSDFYRFLETTAKTPPKQNIQPLNYEQV